MAQSYGSLKKLVLKIKLSPGDSSFTADRDIGVTKGRILFKSSTGATTELISFSGVSSSGSNYVYSNLTRDLSETTDPATSTSTGETWKAGSTGYLVAMHDQIFDRQNPRPTTFATTAARDTALGADGAATEAYVNIYVTATGLHYNYNLSTNQWEALETGTVTPNASTTVAGKVEIATTAQSISAASDTGETGAYLSATLSDIAKNAQSGTFIYGADAGGDDTYVVALTPALTAYTTGQTLTAKLTTANTGACTIDFGPGVKNIKLIDGTDPLDGDIAAGGIYDFIYDGTNMILQSVAVRATSAEASAGTNTTKFITPAQATLVTTGFTHVSTTSGDSSVFTATKTGFINFHIAATHTDNQIGGVTTIIRYSTDGGSNYTTFHSVTNNSTGGAGTTTTVEYYGVFFVNIGMKIKTNVAVTSSGSGIGEFYYSL